MVFKDDLEYGSEDDEDSQQDEAGDSEEREFDRAAKAELRFRRELERGGGKERGPDDSYGSEGEAEFFEQPTPKSGGHKQDTDEKGREETREGLLDGG